jgi:hypothetical protein
MDPTLTDPTREETEAAADVLAEAMRQPCDGYWLSAAEDMLRAAARVRLRVGIAALAADVLAVPLSHATGLTQFRDFDRWDRALGEDRR